MAYNGRTAHPKSRGDLFIRQTISQQPLVGAFEELAGVLHDRGGRAQLYVAGGDAIALGPELRRLMYRHSRLARIIDGGTQRAPFQHDWQDHALSRDPVWLPPLPSASSRIRPDKHHQLLRLSLGVRGDQQLEAPVPCVSGSPGQRFEHRYAVE